MEKKQVSPDFYQLIEQRKEEIEAELNSLHTESRNYLRNGHSSNPELENENQLQKRLREVKAILRGCSPVSAPQDNGIVQIGSYVTLLIDGKKEKTVRLEGVAGFDKNVCSLETDIGKQLLDSKKGKTFSSNGTMIKILRICNFKTK